jgi:hypothetical protein
MEALTLECFPPLLAPATGGSDDLFEEQLSTLDWMKIADWQS